ncbi:MAG: hypothetical protein ACK456_13745 [Pseudanabaenaceae cyanobacterium]|jgi:hypothetical protein
MRYGSFMRHILTACFTYLWIWFALGLSGLIFILFGIISQMQWFILPLLLPMVRLGGILLLTLSMAILYEGWRN